MKLIILAAGGGTRLLKLTETLPKCLLPIDDTTILGHQLGNAQKVGIKEVVISIGYKADLVEDYVQKFRAKLTIKTEFNPFYDIANNLISLWNVREEIKNNEIIILNGDDLFDYRILEGLKETKKDISLVISHKEEYDGDDMKVSAVSGKIKKINKVMRSSEATGESIGMMKFSEKGSNFLYWKLSQMVRDKENLNAWYLRAIQEMIYDGVEVNQFEINGLPWMEIDFPEDYEKAQKFYKEFFKE
ncbi:phosphocholine cytidylyltransferase family protein [bacterium]|nr:phosphocholine cytidylyltransferase family protein [bacterium]